MIELDGESHDRPSTQDVQRTRYLESEGYAVLRFQDADVFDAIEGVIGRIRQALAERPTADPSRKPEGGVWR